MTSTRIGAADDMVGSAGTAALVAVYVTVPLESSTPVKVVLGRLMVTVAPMSVARTV